MAKRLEEQVHTLGKRLRELMAQHASEKKRGWQQTLDFLAMIRVFARWCN
jgi:hypothetical protein